jgi:hypothetical protein
MMAEEMSEYSYAALVIGDDRDGAWFWCHTGHKNAKLSNSLVLDVIHNGSQIRYDYVARVGQVIGTGQIIHGLRLAGIGKIPKSVEESGYNRIIEKFLRSGDYRTLPEFYFKENV